MKPERQINRIMTDRHHLLHRRLEELGSGGLSQKGVVERAAEREKRGTQGDEKAVLSSS
jgi:hypothetical protein